MYYASMNIYFNKTIPIRYTYIYIEIVKVLKLLYQGLGYRNGKTAV